MQGFSSANSYISKTLHMSEFTTVICIFNVTVKPVYVQNYPGGQL
jgi:hypothetical protein